MERWDQRTDGNISIGAGVELKGDVKVPGLATVDGTFEGTLTAMELIVGESGKASGQISVDTAEVRGAVANALTVKSKLTVRSTGSIRGALTYSKITVENGAILTGKIDQIDSGINSNNTEISNVISMPRIGD